jgi:hypothetical protein
MVKLAQTVQQKHVFGKKISDTQEFPEGEHMVTIKLVKPHASCPVVSIWYSGGTD